jgi:hypothetical protein
MSKLSWWKTISLLCVFCAVGTIGSPAQTFKTLVNFNISEGYDRYMCLSFRAPTAICTERPPPGEQTSFTARCLR